MSTVGLVVDPGASRDVRRLTSLARTIDANEQARRASWAVSRPGPADRAHLPEASRVVGRAREVLSAAVTVDGGGSSLDLRPVALGGDGMANDAAGTTEAAAAMASAGATCLVTLAGDGRRRRPRVQEAGSGCRRPRSSPRS